MKLISTRNNKNVKTASFAIENGIAQDKGLFSPVDLNVFSLYEIQSFVDYDYQKLATKILSNLLNDFTEKEVDSCVKSAYTHEKFDGSPAPLKIINDDFSFLELWHGKTYAFKDLALSILPYLVTISMQKQKQDKKALILVATSGDTGKAALEGFKNVENTKILVFYPQKGVSDIQKLQMQTQEGKNVFVCGINGNFDDAQSAVKQIFINDAVKEKLANNSYFFSSANSINFGRLAPQIVYYFSSYLNLLKNNKIKIGEEINFVVPTGNFGNILAGYYAKKMGLPIKKLICASNKNNILTDFINTGVYDMNRDYYPTNSPSMDILISSNLERLIFELSDMDSDIINSYMNDLQSKKKYEVSSNIKEKLQKLFYCDFADEKQTREAIKDCYNKYNYVVDTHTAVAYYVYKNYISSTGDKTQTIIVSTASPYKFSEDVLLSLTHENFDSKTELEKINKLESISKVIPPNSLIEMLNKKPIYTKVIDKEDILDTVLSQL